MIYLTLSCDEMVLVTDGFISIDCGVDEDYVDETTGIFYRSDNDFITTGQNRDISPGNEDSNPYYGRQLSNLRMFSEGRRNCYSLRPAQGKNNNYLIRAFFQYGNYDFMNKHPSFDLYLGVTYWDTVGGQNESWFSYYEIGHFSLTDTIYFCLVNTGQGIPFISALELRLLDNSIYRVEPGSFACLVRYDLGAPIDMDARWACCLQMPEIKNQQKTGYKDDVYDRFWQPLNLSDSVSVSTTPDIDIQGSNDSYKVPTEVLRTAVQPQRGLNSLSYSYVHPNSSADLYVYFYFAEIVKVEPGQRREFTITLNGENHGPFTLEYMQPQTVTPTESPLIGRVEFFINSTAQSGLPPLLNAFEILWGYPLPSPTDTIDVDAIMAIKQTYNLKRDDWQGDPCLPRDYRWSGLSCRMVNGSMKITSLNLSSSKLSGEIASSISKLLEIHTLDLSYNELNGSVPKFLAELPNLTLLNLAGNKLTGPVPKSLLEKSQNGVLKLSLDGNPNLLPNATKGGDPNLCTLGFCQKKKHNLRLPIIASVVSVLALLLFSIIAIIWIMKRRAAVEVTGLMELSQKSRSASFTRSDVVTITNNFQNIIGEGGFGKVYLGELKDGTKVAVKLLSKSSRQGYKEFHAEVQHLMVVHHRNLVSLIGYCDENDTIALVYEYMANGNLRENLFETSTALLNWNERLQIAVDAASGLDYLHNGCKPPIVHRDFKTSNILLNENMQAKIADFGLSRAFTNEMDTHVTTCPAGTPGYVDPEFQSSGHLNKKSDVYSFGVVLFELITGQPAIIRGHEGNTHIVHWVHPIIDRGDIQSIVDPRLEGEFSINSAWKAVEVAMACVPPVAVRRPDMSLVLAELKECLAMEMPFGRSGRTLGNMSRLSGSCEMNSLIVEAESVPAPR